MRSWFACLWGLQTIFVESPFDTWKGSLHYCWITGDLPPISNKTVVDYGDPFASPMGVSAAARAACPCNSPGAPNVGEGCYMCRSDAELCA